MTIINDEFVRFASGTTIRITAILALNIEEGYVWVDEIGHIFVENSDELATLHDHWIRVISARMGIHYSPAEAITEELPMKPSEPYALRKGDETHPLLENHRDRPSCSSCRFQLNGGRACGYLRARHQMWLYPTTHPSSICDRFEDDSELPF